MALSFEATPTRDEHRRRCSIRAPASLPGSRNLPGTADPAVDALIDAVGGATDREKPDRRACARSTGSCARGTTGFQVGIPRITAPPLGHVRLQGAEAGLRLSGRGAVVVRQGQGGGDWQRLRRLLAVPPKSGGIALMGAYILRRILLMIPTLFGHHGDLLRRHPVRAGRAGRAGHRQADRPGRRRHRPHLAAAAAMPAAAAISTQAAAKPRRNTAARRASTRNSSPSWRSSSASTSRRSSASA